jgi:hypothetical protein
MSKPTPIPTMSSKPPYFFGDLNATIIILLLNVRKNLHLQFSTLMLLIAVVGTSVRGLLDRFSVLTDSALLKPSKIDRI